MDNIHENCGIAAVYVKEGANSAEKGIFYLYKLLLNLQNRGQLSAGVTTYNKNRSELVKTYRNIGTVNEVFKQSDKARSSALFKIYAGNKGIGHVRYATSGATERSHAQPFERKHGRMWKWFGFCFNGNLANYSELKQRLIEKTGYHIALDTDTEIIMHYLARELMAGIKPNLVKVFSNLSKKFDGAYNIAFINAYGDIAVVRDPLGIRPLSYGYRDGTLLIASESNALINCGVKNFKELEPGKIILIKNNDVQIKRFAKRKRKAHCMFEWVYFSNVGSVLNGKSVYITRTKLGKELAKLETEKITKDHVLVPVPDTAKATGDAMAFELGIPSQEGLMRNRFVGRTFIESFGREDKVENKYTALREILKGKKVILVDDSIVRGTTSKQIVRYLKSKGGAKEVHLRVSCPPIIAPCFYGIDMSTISELLVPNYEKRFNNNEVSDKTYKKIANALGADSVIYQTIPGLVRSIGLPKQDLCMACLNRNYPTPCGKRLFDKVLGRYKKGVKEKKRSYEC